MRYPDKDILIEGYERTSWIIHEQTKGITDAESVLQPPFRGNCLNWILGHILYERTHVLKYLGAEPLPIEFALARYQRGSDPVTRIEDGLPFHELLAAFDLSQQRIVDGLKAATSEKLAETGEFHGQLDQVGIWIAFIYWHETYHTGQFELLRQLTGKNDKVI